MDLTPLLVTRVGLLCDLVGVLMIASSAIRLAEWSGFVRFARETRSNRMAKIARRVGWPLVVLGFLLQLVGTFEF